MINRTYRSKSEFLYNGEKTIVQCNLTDKRKDILKKYVSKNKKNDKDINQFFLYMGESKLMKNKHLTSKLMMKTKEEKKYLY